MDFDPDFDEPSPEWHNHFHNNHAHSLPTDTTALAEFEDRQRREAHLFEDIDQEPVQLTGYHRTKHYERIDSKNHWGNDESKWHFWPFHITQSHNPITANALLVGNGTGMVTMDAGGGAAIQTRTYHGLGTHEALRQVAEPAVAEWGTQQSRDRLASMPHPSRVPLFMGWHRSWDEHQGIDIEPRRQRRDPHTPYTDLGRINPFPGNPDYEPRPDTRPARVRRYGSDPESP
jgi:hypothetical protein